MARVKKTRKVTVTVPEEVAETLDQWAKSGQIESVSRYVSDSILRRMNREEALATWEGVIGGRPPAEMIDRARAARGLPPLAADAVA
jgi:Arc/MetJ-type ribon-helix-helix transcriptional regulator